MDTSNADSDPGYSDCDRVPRSSSNSPPSANDAALLAALSRAIRTLWMNESAHAWLTRGVAAEDDGGLYHPDAPDVLRELRRRHGDSDGFSNPAVKAAYEVVLCDRHAVRILNKITREPPDVVARVLAEIEQCCPAMTIGERVWAWGHLARLFPENVAYQFDANQIRGTCRTVRTAIKRQAEAGAGSMHTGDPTVRKAALDSLATDLGVDPKRLQGLWRDDFDPDAGTLKIRVPGCRCPVELSSPTCEAMRRWLFVRPPGPGRLFCECHARCRREISASEVQEAYDRCLPRTSEACERVALEDLVKVFFETLEPEERRLVLDNLCSGEAWSEGFLDHLRRRVASDGPVEQRAPITPKAAQQRRRRLLARVEKRWEELLEFQMGPKAH